MLIIGLAARTAADLIIFSLSRDLTVQHLPVISPRT